jgi:hypothetical protein
MRKKPSVEETSVLPAAQMARFVAHLPSTVNVWTNWNAKLVIVKHPEDKGGVTSSQVDDCFRTHFHVQGVESSGCEVSNCNLEKIRKINHQIMHDDSTKKVNVSRRLLQPIYLVDAVILWTHTIHSRPLVNQQ